MVGKLQISFEFAAMCVAPLWRSEILNDKRAFGGCLGTRRGRRTWHAAKSFGEPRAGFDPKISEWGNPSARRSYSEYIGIRGKPGELKHLSTRRKRHQQRFR